MKYNIDEDLIKKMGGVLFRTNVTCKKCGSVVEPSIVPDFYRCNKCQSLTNNIDEHKYQEIMSVTS